MLGIDRFAGKEIYIEIFDVLERKLQTHQIKVENNGEIQFGLQHLNS